MHLCIVSYIAERSTSQWVCQATPEEEIFSFIWS